MQLLLIKISAIDAKPEYALLGKKQLKGRYSQGDWSEVRSLARGRRVLLLVPNNDIVLTSISIPSKNRKQLLQAIPFALEDSLTEDLEDLHFAIHQNDDSNNTDVAIVNRSLLDAYLNLLKKHGISTHFVLPQLLAQPIAQDVWSIQQNAGDTISIRLNDLYGFSCDKNLLGMFLEVQKIPQPKIIYSNLDKESLPEDLQDLPLKKLVLGIVHYESIADALPLNLLTGFISQKNNNKSINWKAWRPALVLGSLVTAAWVGIFGWQNNVLQQEQKQLSLAIEKTFKTAFPDSRLVDPPQQMSTKLAALKKNAGKTVDSPLPLIADISPLLKEYKDMKLKEIRYQENELVLVMQSPNLTRLETFKKDAIEKASLQVDIKSSTTTADKVEATLIIAPLNLSQIDQEKA